MRKIRTKGDLVFDICNYALMAVLMLICIYPLWYVVIGSISDAQQVSMGNVILLPKGFNLDAYKQTLSTENIMVSYANTIYYSIVGVAMSMLFTVLGAYPISKNRLHGKKFFTIFFSISMWFTAGMMPSYVTYDILGLIDTRMGVILSGLLSTFNLIIMRTAFQGVPDSLEESMKLDGASDTQILIHCYLPLTVPTFMTLVLFYFVTRWNTYWWPMIILKDSAKIPLQVLLKKLVVEMQGLFENMEGRDITKVSQETMVYSTMVIAVAPMLILYPFIQRFFVKGVTVGAVKG